MTTPDRSRPLHVLICNERLLPRFGVDRVLLLLGRGLVARAHRVSFVCLRCDGTTVATVSRTVIEAPELDLPDLHAAETAAARLVAERWTTLCAEGTPDVVVVGGWPFFSLARLCRRLGVPSVFIDAGAVPLDGLASDERLRQQELRRVRVGALAHFTAVLPVSSFIRDQQTVPDRGSSTGVDTVLHGSDHLAEPMFAAAPADAAALAAVRRQIADGLAPILLLGRFEARGYKNSPCAFDVLTRILASVPRARLLVLAKPGALTLPAAVRHAVVPLGFVSDAALAAIMRDCRLGLTVSLWEGFNLPLAELQWSGRPALAFAVGAHPEVIADPWLLCGGVAEMADKAVRLLHDDAPPHLAGAAAYDRFRARFRWQDKIARYAGIIETLAATPPVPRPQPRPARQVVLVDCTNAADDPANPGVIRVTRRLGQALQRDPALLLVFVRWHKGAVAYRTLLPSERAHLASYDGPQDSLSLVFSPSGHGMVPVDDILAHLEGTGPPVLFLPETVLDATMAGRLVWARARGMAVAALLHDLIPVTHAVFSPPDVVSRFPEYLEGLAACDAVWAVSGETARQFARHLAYHRLPRPRAAAVVTLPAQFGAQPRATSAAVTTAGEIIATCIASIDPRKNHRTLIAAVRALFARRPELQLRLVLVGHRFEAAEGLADWLVAVTREEPRITWTGLLADVDLAVLVRRSAFTIYPSLVEGYGLPVVESLWLGCPCLCHAGGIMAELATGGGCQTVDMADPMALAQAIETLADDADLRRQLTEQALRRPLADWAGYGAGIGARLRELARATATEATQSLS